MPAMHAGYYQSGVWLESVGLRVESVGHPWALDRSRTGRYRHRYRDRYRDRTGAGTGAGVVLFWAPLVV